jgi:hypothetical protein
MKNKILNTFCEYEKKGGVFPLLNFQFKWIGFSIAFAALIGLILVKTSTIEQVEFFKELSLQVILIGLFLIVLSKEKREDERIRKLRYRAFAFAFVLGTVVLLLAPFAAILLDAISGRLPLEWEQDQGFFFIMSSYLFYFIMYFQIFKRQL